MVTKRGGINLVTTINEQEQLGLESLVTEFSTHLPHRGGVPPIFVHKLPQYIPAHEYNESVVRMNGSAIDKRTLKS